MVVEDLESGNGTFVNGQMITQVALEDGDEVEIPPFAIQVRMGVEPPRSATPVLRVVRGPDLDAQFPLDGEEVGVGRGSDQGIRLSDKGCSRAHMKMIRRGEDWIVRDLGSVNGVFVNGTKVLEAPVSYGDDIAIGGTVFQLDKVDDAGVSVAHHAVDDVDEIPTDADVPSPLTGASHDFDGMPDAGWDVGDPTVSSSLSLDAPDFVDDGPGPGGLPPTGLPNDRGPVVHRIEPAPAPAPQAPPAAVAPDQAVPAYAPGAPASPPAAAAPPPQDSLRASLTTRQSTPPPAATPSTGNALAVVALMALMFVVIVVVLVLGVGS